MLDRIGSGALAGLTLVLGCTLVGCGATGLAWVDEPEPASGWSGPEQQHSVANTPVPAARADSAIPAVADAESTQASRPRLSHTVTLGAIDVPPPSGQPASAYGPNVSVTINNYGQAGASPYAAGYYSGYAGFARTRGGGAARIGSVTSVSRTGSASPQPGQNWPAVADHGTSFPYRSAPASPWSGDGRRP